MSAQRQRVYGQLPLVFERNSGQSDPQVRFFAHAKGYSVFITRDKALLLLRRGKDSASVSVQLSGGPGACGPQGESPLASYSNYYQGGKGGHLECDFEISAGTTLSELDLHVDGAKSLGADRDGNLVIHTRAGDLIQRAPLAWQIASGVRRPVDRHHRYQRLFRAAGVRKPRILPAFAVPGGGHAQFARL